MFMQVPWHMPKSSLTFGYLTTHFALGDGGHKFVIILLLSHKMMSQDDAQGTTTEILYWWPFTTLIWLVRLSSSAGETLILF